MLKLYFHETYFSVIAELEASQSTSFLGYKLLCVYLWVSEWMNECVYIKILDMSMNISL